MTAIAAAANVALDTVYTAVGTKPVLFRLLLETAISRAEAAVPAQDRDYVRAIQAAPDAADLIATGQLRPSLDVSEVADTLWATNSPELFLLLSRVRRWTHLHSERWPVDCWHRVFLATSP